MLVHSSGGGGRGRGRGRGPGGVPRGERSLLEIIRAARSSGSLILSNLELSEVPAEVYALADPIAGPSSGGGGGGGVSFDGGGGWWEVTDLTKLVLSHNHIREVGADVALLEHLVALDLSHNALESLPDSLGELMALKSLDVSHNALRALPEGLGHAPALVQLKCSANQLVALPESLGSSGALEVLDASNNRLTSLPEVLAHCRRLSFLDVQGNSLAQVPPSLGRLVAAGEVILSRNRVGAGGGLPDMSPMSRLTRLEIKEMGLSELPATLGLCSSLVEIHAGFNRLTAVPPSLAELRKLKVLDVRNNAIRAFPLECCSLELTLLDLSNNDLSQLPPELGLMSTLRKVALEGNPLRQLRPNVVSGPTPALLRTLADRIDDGGVAVGAEPQQVARAGNVFGLDERGRAELAARHAAAGAGGGRLSICGAGLEAIPPAMWEGAGTITSLKVDKNRLISIDVDALATCHVLAELTAAANMLRQWPLPQAPGSLAALTCLDLSQNPIESMPAGAFAAAPGLLRLDLSGIAAAAALAAPPMGLAAVPGLQELRLANCRLRAFPPGVGDLVHLRVLDVESNQIGEVPIEVARLGALEELVLSNNDVAQLPAELGLLPRLRNLALEGNPLRSIRRPIIARGTPAVLEYLRDKLPSA